MAWQRDEKGACFRLQTWVDGVSRPIHQFSGAGVTGVINKQNSKASTHEESSIRWFGRAQGFNQRGHRPQGDTEVEIYGKIGGTLEALDKFIGKVSVPSF